MFSFFRKKPASAPTAEPTRESSGLIGTAVGQAIEIPVAPAPAAGERKRWMARLAQGLRKTGSALGEVFSGAQIDDAFYDELETALLMADTGVKATQQLVDEV